jgi:hypothetical protein
MRRAKIRCARLCSSVKNWMGFAAGARMRFLSAKPAVYTITGKSEMICRRKIVMLGESVTALWVDASLHSLTAMTRMRK